MTNSFFTARRMSEVEQVPVKWLWPGYIPLDAVTMMDGDPGASKSTVLADLAALVSRGSSMPDGADGIRGKVLVLTGEDSPEVTFGMRLDAAGADRVNVFADAEVWRFPKDLDQVQAAMEHIEPAMVVIDPIGAYLTGPLQRVVIDRLTEMARRLSCAILVARHLRKGSGPAMYAGLGGAGVIGAARAGYLIARDDNRPEPNMRVMACVKINDAEEPQSLRYRVLSDRNTAGRIECLGYCDVSADRFSQGRGSDRSALRRAIEFLRDLLKDGPRTYGGLGGVREQVKESGHSLSTVRRAMTPLGVESHRFSLADRERGAGFWVWYLPEHAGWVQLGEGGWEPVPPQYPDKHPDKRKKGKQPDSEAETE